MDSDGQRGDETVEPRGDAPGGTGREACYAGVDPDAPEPRSSGYRGFPPAKGRAAPGLDEQGRLRSGRLRGLTLNRAIWVLAWPIFIESLLNSMVGLTDTVLAAQLGADETDAIGGASYINWFIGLTAMAIGVGSTAIVSRAVGRGRTAVANAVVGQTILLQLVAGSIVAILIILGSGYIASALNMTEGATAAFESYMSIVALGVPMMGVMFGLIACARGAGDSLRPLLVMTVVNVVNIVVSFALVGTDLSRTRLVDGEPVSRVIVANPFGFDLGVQGIAIGTVAAHAVGAILMLAIMIRGKTGVRLIRRRLRPHWHTIRRLVRQALPNYLETFGLWFGNAFVLLLVGLIGSGALGSHIIAIRVEAFSFLPGFAMGTAAATLVGQYLGAGSVALARTAVLRCAFIAAAFMGTLGVLFLLFPRAIVGTLSSQEVHLENAPRLVMICGAVQIPFALAIVFRSAIRGAGDVRAAMVLTWTLTYAVRLPLVYALCGVAIPLGNGHSIANPFGFEPSLAALWLAMCIELVIRGAAYTVRFAQGAWATKKV